MLNLIGNIARFFWSVVRHISALITGGVVAAGVFLYEHQTRQNIPMNAVYWGVAVFFIVGCFLTWLEEHKAVAELKAQLNEGTKLEKSQDVSPAALEIIFGSGRDYEKTKNHNMYANMVSTFVGIRNVGGKLASTCKVTYSIAGDLTTYFLDSFSLNAGDERHVQIASWLEPISTAAGRMSNSGFIQLLGTTKGGNPPRLEVEKENVLHLKVTSADCPPAECLCRLYVNEAGKLRMERGA